MYFDFPDLDEAPCGFSDVFRTRNLVLCNWCDLGEEPYGFRKISSPPVFCFVGFCLLRNVAMSFWGKAIHSSVDDLHFIQSVSLACVIECLFMYRKNISR